MRAFKKLLVASSAAAALLLSGCGNTLTEPDLTPRNLTDSKVIAEYCGEAAVKVANLVTKGAEAPENSAKRQQLKLWGIDDPKNNEQLTAVRNAIQARTKVECGEDGKPLGLTVEQQEASKLCLSAEEQQALKPGEGVNEKLIAACKQKGQTVYDGLSAANKNQKTTADNMTELKATADLSRATHLVNYLVGVNEKDKSGLVITDKEAFGLEVHNLLGDTTKEEAKAGSSGPNPVDHNAHTPETGGAPFYHGNNVTYLDSPEAIAKWFASGTPEANAAKERVIAAIKAAGRGDDEIQRAITGAGYAPLQMVGKSQIMGTTYYVDGQVHTVDQWRESLAGDMYWLFVTADGHLIGDATLRADCGNIGAKKIRPVRPDTPPAPSVTQPPGEETCPPGTVMQPNGECKPPIGNPVCTENCTPLQPKDYTQGSGYQGKAPTGSGLNADPGPGEYKAPSQMEQPPSTPYVAPAAPAPQPAPVQQQDGTVIPAPNPNPTPFTPAPEEPGVNPAPVPGSSEPPRNEGEIDNPWG